jgi:hypothetical protein
MTICGGGGLHRARSFAFEQIMVVSCGSTDLRWALAALALQSLSVAGATCRILLVSLAQSAARHAASARRPAFAIRLRAQLSRRSRQRRLGERFARSISPADTTVAAGRG